MNEQIGRAAVNPARVDSHHHVWDLTARERPWTKDLPVLRRSFALDDLLPSLDAHGIQATVLVQTVCVPDETPELLALAAARPAVAAVVGWVDLTAADVADQLAALRGSADGRWLAGVRHQVQAEPDPFWLCRDDVRRGLRALQRVDLAYDLLVTQDQLAAATATVRALPNIRFIVDHAGNPTIGDQPPAAWSTQMSELGRLPNVAVKLSGSLTQVSPERSLDQLRPYVNRLLGWFGPDRIMFGSDWPVCLLGNSYSDVVAVAQELTADLSQAELGEIFGGAAARWYRIDG